MYLGGVETFYRRLYDGGQYQRLKFRDFGELHLRSL